MCARVKLTILYFKVFAQKMLTSGTVDYFGSTLHTLEVDDLRHMYKCINVLEVLIKNSICEEVMSMGIILAILTERQTKLYLPRKLVFK